MLWRVHKTNPMARVLQKSGTCSHRLQDTTFTFDTKADIDTALTSHQAHQGFRLGRIELISDKDPFGLWVTKSSSVRVGPIEGVTI